MSIRDLTLDSGRALRIWTRGPLTGLPLLYLPGTPAGVTPEPEILDAAERAGVGVLSIARPGYPGSARLPGRDVLAVVLDLAQVLAQLNVRGFVALGWSGGGPHALACAARLPGCRAVATLASTGPPDTDLDLSAGMAAENVEEIADARAGEATLRARLVPLAAEQVTLDPAALIASMGDLLPAADRASLTLERAAFFADSTREALADGVEGWLDDDLALVAPWGFSPAEVAVPVAVWQGEGDTMVPIAHGRWLADHLPTARAHLLPGEGHLSVGLEHLEEIVADLVGLAAGTQPASPTGSERPGPA